MCIRDRLLTISNLDFESSFKLGILTIMNTVNSSMFNLSNFDFSSLSFLTKIYLINSDNKKIHLVLEMINFNTNKQVAVCETLLINVDLNIRKSVEYDIDVINRIEDYKKNCKIFNLPLQIGKEIKIRKK